jgi:glycosyltransferase involved in cell wall biosynthesis
MLLSIIIPCKNDECNISNVIDASNNSFASVEKEIIIVEANNNRISGKICENKSVSYVMQDYKGKGDAMRCGFNHSKGDIITYSDADIININPEMIENVVLPLLNDEFDFVNGSHSNISRVEEFVIKPLLKFAFPEIYKIERPTSGQIGGRREFFEQIDFCDGWGVDIGLKIDMLMLGARILDIPLPIKEELAWKHYFWQENFIEEIIATIFMKIIEYERLEKIKGLNLSILFEKTFNVLKGMELIV